MHTTPYRPKERVTRSAQQTPPATPTVQFATNPRTTGVSAARQWESNPQLQRSMNYHNTDDIYRPMVTSPQYPERGPAPPSTNPSMKGTRGSEMATSTPEGVKAPPNLAPARPPGHHKRVIGRTRPKASPRVIIDQPKTTENPSETT